MIRRPRPTRQRLVAVAVLALSSVVLVGVLRAIEPRINERVGPIKARQGESESPAVVDLNAAKQLVGNYCLDCHTGADPAGELNLEAFDQQAASYASPEWSSVSWEKMLKRLHGRQMPPIEATRPSETEYEQAIVAIEAALDHSAQLYPKPGRTESLRRLNRTEYRNAIRDLLALDVEVEKWLPADESSHGFDNVTVAELSPTHLDRYLTAAKRVSRLAIGSQARSPDGASYRIPADQTQAQHVEGLPLGTRGGGRFEHAFVQDGEYEIQIRLTRDRDEHVEGLHGEQTIHLLVDRQLQHEFRVNRPANPADHTKVDVHLKVRIPVKAGPHDVGVTFLQNSEPLSEIKRQPFDASFNLHRHPRRLPAIFEVSITGPYSPKGSGATPSRERLLVCQPARTEDYTVCAKEILQPLLRKAYRRPITAADMEVPLRFFAKHAGSDGFEAGIEAALTSILVNPNFLIRIETDPPGLAPGSSYPIGEFELASRLSFFLWSSLPDEQLLSLAEAGKLSQPDVLSEQTRRMLADERAESMVSNFADQWLYLRNLEGAKPDMRLFPDFDNNLREAFRQETQLLFEHIQREDLSVLTLLNANFSYLNERLAKHYGIANVFGSHFRKVQLDPTVRRGGLLRQGSILTVTSYATRTSPTIRGNWILENLIGTPPPPPPPNVPALKQKTSLANSTVRELLAEHRENPACASCHDLMDPIGFALDNYDAVGRWRDFEEGRKIDVSGVLPDGTDVSGIDDLESAILKRPEMFVETLVSKLLTYALGRGMEPTDGPAIRGIVRSAAAENYRFSSLIAGITSSEPFLKRSTRLSPVAEGSVE